MIIDLAAVITDTGEYEEIVELFTRIDEIMADSVFTEMVFDAFQARYREMVNQ